MRDKRTSRRTSCETFMSWVTDESGTWTGGERSGRWAYSSPMCVIQPSCAIYGHRKREYLIIVRESVSTFSVSKPGRERGTTSAGSRRKLPKVNKVTLKTCGVFSYSSAWWQITWSAWHTPGAGNEWELIIRQSSGPPLKHGGDMNIHTAFD